MKPLLKASDEAEFKRRLYESDRSLALSHDTIWRWLKEAGIAEKPLEEGWYWVRDSRHDEWGVAYLSADDAWCHDGLINQKQPPIIGPRILPPSQEGTDGK